MFYIIKNINHDRMRLAERILSTKQNQLKKLWVKPHPDLKKSCISNFETIGGKLSKDGEKIESRLFALKKDRYLCYKKLGRNSKFKGALDLRWSSLEFISLPLNSVYQAQGFGFTIRITKDGRFTHIFVKDKGELEAWRSALSATGTFMHDFECLYSIVEPLNEGTYGKVILNFKIK